MAQTSALAGTAVAGTAVASKILTQATTVGFEGGPGMVATVEGGVLRANPWNRRTPVTTVWTRRTASVV